jgi:hypothetical protein
MSRRDKQAPWMGRSVRLVPASVASVLSLALVDAAVAQQAQSLNGPPVQVIPYASEPGVPTITINPGTPNPFPMGGGSGTGGSGGGNTGDSSALTTLMGTSWGSQAIQNAEALGVNPSALAATCVLESGCSQPSGGGGAQGVFQMFPAAYQEGLATALAANPGLAPQIVQGSAGMNDPTTEAIAAAGYLMQANQALENAGISNTTVVQARSYYNFGPSAGVQIAQASGGDLMSQYLSPGVMSANGVTPGETVAQWQAAVSAKIGNAGGQTVLT